MAFADLDEVEMLTPSPYLVGNAGTIKISCRVHGNAFSDVKLQANIGKDYWVSLQLNAYNISKEAGFSTWQYHFSEEFYHVTNFRCVANSTEGAFIASKGLIVKYQCKFVVFVSFNSCIKGSIFRIMFVFPLHAQANGSSLILFNYLYS